MAATPVMKKSKTVTTKSTPIWAPPQLRTAYLPAGSLLSSYHADGDEAGERRSRSGSERASEQLTSFAMSYSSTSLQVAAKLGLGGIFNLNASAGGKAVLLDVACMTDFYEEQPAIDDLPGYGIRHGIGIRLPPDIIQSWLKSTKVSGSLADESNYLALQELLGKQIPEYLQSDRTLTPLAYTVLTTDQSDPTSMQRPSDAACRTANDWIRIS